MLIVKNNKELTIFLKSVLKVAYLCNKISSVLWVFLNKWWETTSVRNRLEFLMEVLHKVLDQKELLIIVYM